MMTVVKLSSEYQVKLCYQAEVIERQPQGVIVSSTWTLPTRDLGCTCFEPGDRFIEYYYSNRWFNIQEVVDSTGLRKGWYCDIAEPAVIEQEQIRLIDLELDVWVSAQRKPLTLDEEEFEASPLSEAQRHAAREGLQALLHMLEARQVLSQKGDCQAPGLLSPRWHCAPDAVQKAYSWHSNPPRDSIQRDVTRSHPFR